MKQVQNRNVAVTALNIGHEAAVKANFLSQPQLSPPVPLPEPANAPTKLDEEVRASNFALCHDPA